MKINGKKLDGPNVEVIVIPRQSGDLVFKARALLSFDEHDKINPQPEPSTILRPGGIKSKDVEDPKYITKLDEWATQKYQWVFLKSLEATPGLEWETIDMANPLTWKNYTKEMAEGGLSPSEIVRIEICVTDACGLNQQKIDEATKRFLAGQAQALIEKSSQGPELSITPSGEPASVSK